MNRTTTSPPGPRAAAALAAAAAVTALATACGTTSAPSPASAPAHAQVLALARCMRSHGLPNFPNPPASGQGITASPENAGIDPGRRSSWPLCAPVSVCCRPECTCAYR